MVIKPFLLLGLRAEYRSRQWVWSTGVRRPSDVYDTHLRTKLAPPETISHSRNYIIAHQNLKGSCDLTTPFSGHANFDLSTKFEAPNTTRYKGMKDDTKCQK